MPSAREALPAFELPAGAVRAEPFTAAVELLEDPSRELLIEDVSGARFDAEFEPATPDRLNIGFTHSAWWIRFDIANTGERPRELFLRQTYPLIDGLELYERSQDGEWRKLSTGDRQVFSSRPVAHRDFLFPLSIPQRSVRSYYLRYESQGPIDISLAVLSADEAIKVVANALRRHTRKPFTACRYGGEEFAVILPGANAMDAEHLAERVRATVQESLGSDLAITISVGHASLSHGGFEHESKLFEAADFALYSAKQQGRNRVVAFSGWPDPDMNDVKMA
jgi:hypothetical protein